MNLIDSSLWIDYFRPKTPRSVKRLIDHIVSGADVVTCEPVLFELMRATSRRESAMLAEYFATIPVLPTPETLWKEAGVLGQKCFAAGVLPRSLDLLIAQVSLHHDSTLTTFDDHFEQIATVCQLNVNLLLRPIP